MSDIKKLLLRVPSDIYESIELQALNLKMSVNALIVARLKDSSGTVPKQMESAERTRRIAAALPNTFAGCDIPAPKRPSHAPNCDCFMCRPPK